MSIASSSKSSTTLFSNIRDAVRVLRGRPLKYSQLARGSGHPNSQPRPQGIRTPADLSLATLRANEVPLLQKLVRQSQQYPGPIIEVGTLLGNTTTTLALHKAPEQKIITVDLYCWNPWGITPDAHFTLTRQMLRYLIEAGHVEQIRMDKNEFFRTYKGPAPSMVFLDAIHDYTETKKDILWAQDIGAKIISGHDYCEQFPGVVEVVNEFGGPAELGGTVWVLPSKENKTFAAPAAVSITPSGQDIKLETASIVIPAYNAAPYIGEALADIEIQTYKSWEVIVIEDGTNDGTQQLVEDFQRRNPNHRVVYERFPENRGVSAARNHAFTLCQGDLIAFLDADDRWDPTHLEARIEQLTRSGCDIAYGPVEMFDTKTNQSMGNWGPTSEELADFPDSLFSRTLMQPSGVVAKKSVVRDVGGFSTSLKWAEDLDYWLRCVQKGKKFSYSPKVTSRYRKGVETAATSRIADCAASSAGVCKSHINIFPQGRAKRRKQVAAKYISAVNLRRRQERGNKSRELDRQLAQLRLEAWKLQKHRVDLLAKSLAGYLKSLLPKK